MHQNGQLEATSPISVRFKHRNGDKIWEQVDTEKDTALSTAPPQPSYTHTHKRIELISVATLAHVIDSIFMRILLSIMQILNYKVPIYSL